MKPKPILAMVGMYLRWKEPIVLKALKNEDGSSRHTSVKIPKPSYPDDCLFAPILRDIKYEHTSIAMQSLFRCWPPIYMK